MAGIRTIVVVPYDPLWPEMFEQEAKVIAAVFGPELISIHHIGSTAAFIKETIEKAQQWQVRQTGGVGK